MWEPTVPRIKDQFIDLAVYIYFSVDDAEDGSAYGGSGFMVDVPFETNNDLHYLYVVTNRHVIEHSDPVIRLNRKDGTVTCVPTKEEQWIVHPDGDDVAIFHIDTEWENWQKLQIATMPIYRFVSRQLVIEEDVGIGDDTVMVGRFVNHEGKQRNTPSVRFGNVAMMPKEKIMSKNGFMQESFLVETRSLPGYSGSAVLLYSPCAMNDMSERRFGKARNSVNLFSGKTTERDLIVDLAAKGPYLLGIDWCHLLRSSPVTDNDGKALAYEWKVSENTGMAGVIPAWKIAEVLNSEAFMKDRQKEAERIAKASSGIGLDSAEKSKTFTKEDFETVLKKASRKLQVKPAK